MKVAVTGANGHVGANLCRALLEQGRQVKAGIHNSYAAIDGLDLEITRVDVLQPDSLDNLISDAEVVYHMAAMISIVGDPAGRVTQTNVEGTRNTVQACMKHRVKKLIHFSSIHAICPYPLDQTVDESCPYDDSPKAFAYNRSKAEGEKIVMKAAQDGLDASVINPTSVIGPYDYQPSLMGQVFIDLKKRQLPSLIKGGFDWVDVRDVVKAALAAEQQGGCGERYIISGHWTTVKELAEIVEEVANVKAPRFTSPIWAAKMGVPLAIGYARLTNTTPLFTYESLEALRQYKHISSAKAQKELGYNARPLEQTVRDIYEWFDETGMLN